MHARSKTHQSVLPQQAALESVSADKPTGVRETGHGHHHHGAVVPGMRLGRGETPAAGSRSGRHPGTTAHAVVPGDRGRKVPASAHPVVFVLDRNGRPLQPCRPARARRLLREGRAVVHRHTPFVIRLKDREFADAAVPGVQLGIDPGSKHTGVAVFTGWAYTIRPEAGLSVTTTTSGRDSRRTRTNMPASELRSRTVPSMSGRS